MPRQRKRHRALVVALCWVAGLLIAPVALYGVLVFVTQPALAADLTATNVVGPWKSVESTGSITINDDGTFSMNRIAVNPIENRKADFTASGTWYIPSSEFRAGQIMFDFEKPTDGTLLGFESEQSNGVISLWYRIVDTERKYEFKRIGD